jgi:D-alanine--D-alanine ligase
MKISLLCGGPSLEKGISLNSARSVLDHLSSDSIEIIPIYFDARKNAYQISTAQLYCNTPSDFDFKLRQTATPLSKHALVQTLKKNDLTFSTMHGPFGEDGEIQSFLEKHDIPFVGTSASACKQLFDKFIANEFIKQNDFFTLPSEVLKIYHKNHSSIIQNFFKKHSIKRAVVKPATGGSSIGVFSVTTPKEALEKAELLFSKRIDTRVVIEPFAEGIEFTTIILQNRFGMPVALPPTEIETDYTKNQIFDFRRKYLPTRQVVWHCPPRFQDEIIDKIQMQAEQLFALFKMRDFARFDGWVFPDGNIWFSDFNPISGMEQNSFIFQQTSRIGMTHADALLHVVQNACSRYGIDLPKNTFGNNAKAAKPVHVLFGGNTSERQVSLMSGTNVWLKLRKSKKYQPKPFLLDKENNVWSLPYHLTLNHTVEEITENCKNYLHAHQRLKNFEKKARDKLGIAQNLNNEDFCSPYKLSLNDFIKNSEFIFNALHGGDGENGTFQELFAKSNVKFNGPDSETSRLCINKFAAANFIAKQNISGISPIQQKLVAVKDLLKLSNSKLHQFWINTRKELNAKTLVIKPNVEGCSTGVVHLYSVVDLTKYLTLLTSHVTHITQGTFKNQYNIIELSPSIDAELLFERYVETDILRVKNNQLKHKHKTGWIETTIGVIEHNGKIKSLNPSITIADYEILTVEEKFQGGTGVNITPPPSVIIPSPTLAKIKKRIETLAAKIGIKGYARIDTFVNIDTGDLLIIEINTLPALTPSTVLYHQALTENPAIFPKDLLEILIANKNY